MDNTFYDLYKKMLVDSGAFEYADKDRMIFEKCVKRADVDDKDVISYSLIKDILPKRNTVSHKGTYGRSLCIGGSVGMTGAAAMCSESMLKSGAGLVTLVCAKSLNNIFECCLKEVMTYPMDDEDGFILKKNKYQILDKANSSDAVCIGCGMGRNKNISSIVRYLIKYSEVPLIIDADGINAISENIDVLYHHPSPIILTPHFGEFSRLTGFSIDDIAENTIRYAVDFAKEYNVIIVLKSHNTVVAFPDGKYFVNILGNPGMATAGSGDVLSGIITGMTAQLKNIRNSVLTGVFLHSLSGDIAKEKVGEYSLCASDIIDNISCATKYIV